MISLPPFSAQLLLDQLREHGASLRVDPEGRLMIQFGEKIVSTPELVQAIQRHKSDLLRLLADEAAPRPAEAAPFGAKTAAYQARVEQEAGLAKAQRLLVAVRATGSTVTLTGDRITVSPRPSEALASKLIEAKPLLLDILRREQAEEGQG